MIVITAFSTALALTYFTMARWWLQALKRPHSNPQRHEGPSSRVSVLVPFRNEAANLRQLLADLKSQRYPSHLFEVIFIDDHSTDAGAELLRQAIVEAGAENMHLISNSPEQHGKKAALANAWKLAQGDIIFQTDADCRVKKNWLESLVVKMEQKKAVLALGPVRMRPRPSFWSRFAALEFMSLQAAGAAMAKAGKPIMGSAANLAYRKSLVEESTTGAARAGGDDVFLIQDAAKQGQVIYTLHPDAMVDTPAPEGFEKFIAQRARWGGKSLSYRSSAAIAVAFVVAATAVWEVCLLLLGGVYPLSLYLFLGFLIVKMAADYPLLRNYAKRTHQTGLMRIFFPASVAYPFYIMITGFAILFTSVKWKERKMRPLTD